MISSVPIVICGAGGHAKVVADVIRLQGRYEIVGFLDDVDPDRCGIEFCGSHILGGEEQLVPLYERGIRWAVLAFGNNTARLGHAIRLQALNFQLANVIHPSAVISRDVRLGPGTVVMAGVIVNPSSVIKLNVILNTGSTIDHDCFIEDGAHICPGVHLGGGVSVGKGTSIGIGATVKDHVSIGTFSSIGAGSVVIHDIPDHVVAYGNPAKLVRRRTPDETQE